MNPHQTVLFFTGTMEAGGLERFISRVCIEAKKRNTFNPVVVCLHKRVGIFISELESSGVTILEAPAGWKRNPLAIVRLSKLIRSQKPMVVHSQVNFSILQQFMAVGLFNKTRFFITERNCYPLSGWARVRRIFQFYMLKLFKVEYSANSIAVAEYLSRMVKYPIQKIPVITNGIEVPESNPQARNLVRSKYGWSDQDFVIGYIARFADHKGHEFFLETMRYVQTPPGSLLRICFIGDGPTRTKMEALAKSVESFSVKFFGVVAVQDFYHAFDCTALFSEYEGMPNVVMEGMANGLPVVANPVGNVEELFAGDAGIVNYFKDPVSAAKIFTDLAHDPLKRERIGTLARAKVKKMYSIEKTLSLLSRHYGIDG